ncbi:MAG: TspO/MBR family protein [Clostridiaceae bacterium]
MDRTKKAWTSGVLFALTLVINTIGAAGWINGLSQKEVSDKYITLITPEPGTFSIWGVIYSLMLISIIMMLVKKGDMYYKKAIDEISVLFWISCIMNTVWIVSFSLLQLGLSVIFIFGLLITLSLILQKLRRIQEGRRFLLPLTFGLYTGWLFIATVVNIAAWLVKMEWGRFGIPEEIWAIIMLVIAVLLVFVVLMRNRNAVFPLPVAWAYLGIYQFLNSPEGFKGQFVILQMVSLAGMVVLIGMAAIQFYRNRFSLLLDTLE